MSAAWERAVREVGDWIRGERREFAANRVESKSLNSLVSYVDQQAEQMLVQRLTDALPGSGVLGEEGGESWVDGGANWIIDPLDGTTNFIHDLPPYAVSVALMQDRELVWAAVYELGQARMFTAAKGHGAFCDGQPLGIAGGAALRDGLVATGFP
ncbi:MAG: inositol monophosphatase family protein, partial [Schleiferiaceae bacterium]